jgi:hypothetical protein
MFILENFRYFMKIFIACSIIGVFNSNNPYGKVFLLISVMLFFLGFWIGMSDFSYNIENSVIKINIFENSYRVYNSNNKYLGRIRCNEINKKQCFNLIVENNLPKYIL